MRFQVSQCRVGGSVSSKTGCGGGDGGIMVYLFYYYWLYECSASVVNIEMRGVLFR